MVSTGSADPAGVYFGFCSTPNCSGADEVTPQAESVYIDFDQQGNFSMSLNDGGMVDSSEMVIAIEGIGARDEIQYRVDNVLGTCRTDSLRN